MNIGKAAKLSNLTIKTVRYYANIGLVKPEQNISSGYREYTDEEVAKLKFIGKARTFDFSINECKELLSLSLYKISESFTNLLSMYCTPTP